MSITELEVIHRTETTTKASRFLLPHDDQEDTGLVMKLDGVKETTLRSPNLPTSTPMLAMQRNASAVRPSAVSSQLCGQNHEVTGWVLRGALFLQTAHIPLMKLTYKVNEAIQRKMHLLMSIFLYMSLLVLVAQAGAVIMLFSQALMPLGMWFLLCCIVILGGMFCYTAFDTNQRSKSLLLKGSKML